MKNNATAIWKGNGKEGSGTLSTAGKVLDKVPYSFLKRSEGRGNGTTPEELIAAAHAGCFTMKLAFLFAEAGFEPEVLETGCEVAFEDGAITTSHLHLKAKIPGITKEKFDAVVKDAGHNCPVSKALNIKISVEGELEEN